MHPVLVVGGKGLWRRPRVEVYRDHLRVVNRAGTVRIERTEVVGFELVAVREAPSGRARWFGFVSPSLLAGQVMRVSGAPVRVWAITATTHPADDSLGRAEDQIVALNEWTRRAS